MKPSADTKFSVVWHLFIQVYREIALAGGGEFETIARYFQVVRIYPTRYFQFQADKFDEFRAILYFENCNHSFPLVLIDGKTASQGGVPATYR